MSTSRTLLWQQLVTEADPNWLKEKIRPVQYQFSNGREFVWNPQVYTSTSP